MPKAKRALSLGKNTNTFDGSTSGASLMTSSGGRQGSLNLQVRKRENERIERENHKFAQRLFTNGGAINSKKLEEEFKLQEKYRSNISRVKKSKPTF